LGVSGADCFFTAAGGLDHRVYGGALDAGWAFRGSGAGRAEDSGSNFEGSDANLGSWLGGVRSVWGQ